MYFSCVYLGLSIGGCVGIILLINGRFVGEKLKEIENVGEKEYER